MKFGRKGRQDKLYTQWVKHSDLNQEAVPQEENPKASLKGVNNNPPENREKKGLNLTLILYLLLGLSIIIVGVGLYLFLTQTG